MYSTKLLISHSYASLTAAVVCVLACKILLESYFDYVSLIYKQWFAE